MNLEVLATVDFQLAAIAAYIRRDNPDAARRFLQAAYREFDFIAKWPEASTRVRFRKLSLAGTRYRSMRRPFHNYLIFYKIKPDRVVIGSVLWGGMNWSEDLKVF